MDEFKETLIDRIYRNLPTEFEGDKVDADFNDDSTITITLGGTEYLLSVNAVRQRHRR